MIQLLERVLDVPDSLVIDGTPFPHRTGGHEEKRTYPVSKNVLGSTIRSSTLLTTNSLPSLTLYQELDIEKYLDNTTLADKGCIGLGLLTPTKRKPGMKTPQPVKDNNCVINRLRAAAERVISQVKRWRVLHSGFRRSFGAYGRRVFFWNGRWCFLATRYPLWITSTDTICASINKLFIHWNDS